MNFSSDSTFDDFRSGFAAITGAPNAGKSTLLNAMIGEKISITSPKPQTTRNRIAGIVHGTGFQIVFLDTPGVHKSDKLFNRKIVDVALSAMDEVDLILMIADASDPTPASESLLVDKIGEKKPLPAILALNKVDLVEKPLLLEQIQKWAALDIFSEIVPISAKTGLQVPQLVTAMAGHLPPGPAYYPEDALTDAPERFIVAEMIREKVFAHTGQEIPYSTAVTIERFAGDEKKDVVRIHAVIHVERDSQKGIVIGSRGRMLKTIGSEARKDIESLLGTRVFLELFVRVEKDWSKKPKSIRKLGY
ncbi:MAG: GTPase Era [Desulfosalsimonas sp.]|uniref:GTPase Era n=1 Tax=Desulfosalsimonas sp. TaxID=3073848 RepID=UPI0039705D12